MLHPELYFDVYIYFLFQEMTELEARREFVKLNVARKFSNFISLLFMDLLQLLLKNNSNILTPNYRTF